MSRGNFFSSSRSGGRELPRRDRGRPAGLVRRRDPGHVLARARRRDGHDRGAKARAVLFNYVGLSVGGLLSGVLSQVLRSRKKVLLAFQISTGAMMGFYFTVASSSLLAFYVVCFCLGVAIGYWSVFVTVAAEQFGTNLRATVTTTVPNFVRGAVMLPDHDRVSGGEGDAGGDEERDRDRRRVSRRGDGRALADRRDVREGAARLRGVTGSAGLLRFLRSLPIIPSCAVEATRRPSRVKTRPRTRPRAPWAAGLLDHVEEPLVHAERLVEPHDVVEARDLHPRREARSRRGARARCVTNE